MGTPDLVWQEILARRPFYAVAVPLQIHVDAVRRLGEDLLGTCDWFVGRTEFGPTEMTRFHDHFWFWLLGAYEVVRTMDDYSSAFSTSRHAHITDLKRRLARLRVPMAKLQMPGSAGLYDDTGYYSFSGFDIDNGDCSFEISGIEGSVRAEVSMVLDFLASFKVSDIVGEARSVRPKSNQRGKTP